MNSILKNIGASLALLLILFGGCKKSINNANVIENTESLKSSILIKFVNAKPRATNQPKDFPIVVSGQNFGLVLTTSGNNASQVTNGTLELALDQSANPSQSNPIKFTVSANAPGFAHTIKNIIVTNPTEPQVIIINLAEYANMPAGAGLANDTKSITNGTATKELVLTTSTNAGMDQKSKITIPAGTSFLDADGKIINANTISANIVHYGTASNESLSAFPGGFYADNVLGADGLPINGGVFFVTAGFLAIDLVAGDKEVKGFTKPVDIEMEIDYTLKNPTTGLEVKENETIPLWSLNSQTGQWRNEGIANFVKNSAGKLVAKAQISHLSYWNFDWKLGSCNNGFGGTLTINGPKYSQSEFYPFDIVLNNGTKLRNDNLHAANGKVTHYELYQVPSGSGKYVVYDRNYKVIAESPMYASMCGQNTVLTLPEYTGPTIINVSLDLKIKCSDTNLTSGFTGVAFIFAPYEEWWNNSVLWVIDGKAQGYFVGGRTYNIGVCRNDMWYQTELKYQNNRYVLPLSNDFTGTVNFDPATKSLNINGLFTTRKCN